ncbi:MAG: hypothetical protein BWY50_02000 [Spirochaetes bacterium ADurb.Bin315]|nr:MAG: hypothetical protein BWY50_02000 [Spirochaetes bacterium ADurb.Bin315]
MVSRRKDNEDPSSRRPPATTQDGRDRQLIAAAYDLAEKQIADGSVSAQVLTHFLRLDIEKTKLERAKLQGEVKVLNSRAEQIDSGKRMEELYGSAIEAMRMYQGGAPEEEYYDD